MREGVEVPFSPAYAEYLRRAIARPKSPTPQTVDAAQEAVADSRRYVKSSRQYAGMLVATDVLTVLKHRPDLWVEIERELPRYALMRDFHWPAHALPAPDGDAERKGGAA